MKKTIGFIIILLLTLIFKISAVLALTDYSQIPDNTWVLVDQGTYAEESAGTQPPLGIDAYSGMAIDNVNRKILVFGGGHNDYWGNDVWAWDINTQNWQRMYAPDNLHNINLSTCQASVDNVNYPGMWMPSGRPISRHSYYSVDFISHLGVMFAGGASTYSGSGEYLWNDVGNPGGCYPNTPGDEWFYSYSTNQWTYKGNGYTGTSRPRAVGVVAYDSDIKTLVEVGKRNPVWIYNPDANSWIQKSQATTPTASSYGAAAYDSKRKVVYLFGGDYPRINELWAYSVPNNTWTKLPAGGNLPPSGGEYGAAYDSANDVLIIFGEGGLYVFNPNTNQWSQMTSSPSPTPYLYDVVYGKFKYDAINNVVFLLHRNNSNYQLDLWAYRYKQGGTPPPTDIQAPTVPTNLSATAVSSSQINLSWTASSDNVGVTGYRLERCQGSSCTNFSQISTPTATSYSDASLSANTTYRYQVRATDVAGNLSSYSSIASATTQAGGEGNITGLDFPSNGSGTVQFRFTGSAVPSAWPTTYIWRIKPKYQISYYTTFFYCDLLIHPNTAYNFYGAHPYPPGGAGGTYHAWEIAIENQDDMVDENGNNTRIDWPTWEYDRWYTQAVVVRAVAGNEIEVTFYWDLGTSTSRVIQHLTTTDYATYFPPTTPAIVFGDAWWSPGNEMLSGILRGIQIYADDLSLSDIVAESANHTSNTPQTAAGLASVWYMNQNPTPTDISDKSGKGHSPSWYGSNRPMLYTSDGSPDTTAPSISITAPTSGATVSGSSVTVSVNASDNVGVVGVQFKLDGNNLGSEDTTSPYSITWNTTQTTNGSHTLTATARDAAGNQTASSGITVTVNNIASDIDAPTIPTNLSAQAVSSSQINLSWTVSTDNVGVTGYRIYRNATQVGTSATNSYQDTGLSASTTYSYTVSAYDAAGNISGQSSSASATTQSNLPPPPPSSSNYITIKEKAGVTTTNYPIQVGRPFVKGEIPNYPQALIYGTAVTTQADIKTRWPDGSVKHAILTFLIPTLQANSTVNVTFQNQSSGNNSGYLNQSSMLGSNFNFDARMELTNGTTQSASARTMLNNNSFTYWQQGSVATGIILADHSASRQYDIGFDSYRSVRPIFHATFWPTINKVKVRYIGEISNTEAFQDQSYSLVLKLGNSSPSTVYTQSTFTHYAGSRWTKEFWIGGAPTAIDIDHNLTYLAQTTLLPNYDTSKKISESAISYSYSNWQNAPKNLYDAGNWQKAMGTAGGRWDIGPYPTWTIQWLYTGDNRVKQQAFGNADLSAAWPMHFREGKSTKYFDRQKTILGLGKILSISDRPTLTLAQLSYSYTNQADKIIPVGTISNGGWDPDLAHQPDPFSPQYLLTGDFWYLEELLFWASWGAAAPNGAATTLPNGRGPTGAEGGLSDIDIQIRGQAWGLRNRVHAASIAPDGAPEKSYLTILIDDAVAIWEGQKNITNSPFYGNANWNWGRNVGALYWDIGVPSLHHWEPGITAFVQDPLDPAVCKKGLSTWEQNFMMFSLGRAKELGYSTDHLVSWLAVNIIGQITGSGYDPYLSGAYRIPTVRLSDGKFFDTWANLKTGFKSSYDAAGAFIQNLSETDHGYSLIAMAATSMAAAESGGSTAWSWMAQNALTSPYLNDNPKWAILPRAASPAPVLKGDVNKDNSVDSIDLQALVNHILGSQDYGSSADVNSDGSVNALDVQEVVNIILGG